MDAAKNLSAAAKAYQEVMKVEKATGKGKYSEEAKTALEDIKTQMINAAVDAGTAKNYKLASDLLYQIYELDKTDLEKLYYAANYAVNAQDYDKALSLYEELKTKNYSGEGNRLLCQECGKRSGRIFWHNSNIKNRPRY